jgi:DegV family protein with EDD domain
LLGTLLNLKPVLQLQDGRVEPFERVRTRKKAVRRAVQAMAERFNGEGPLRLIVLHAECPDDARELAAQAQATLNCSSLFQAEISPVIGTHGGPGTLGLGGYAEGLVL